MKNSERGRVLVARGEGVALTISQRTHFQLYPVDAPWTATIEPGTDLS